MSSSFTMRVNQFAITIVIACAAFVLTCFAVAPHALAEEAEASLPASNEAAAVEDDSTSSSGVELMALPYEEAAGYDEPGWDGIGEEVTVGDWTYTYYGEYTDTYEQIKRVFIIGYNGTSTSVTIPSVLNGKKVYGVYNCIDFDSCPVTSITVGKGIKEIRYDAFEYGDSLESVTFENGSVCRAICDGAFYGCSSLREFVMPPKLKYLGKNALGGCTSLERIVFNDNLEPCVEYVWDNPDASTPCWWYSPIWGALVNHPEVVIPSTCKNYKIDNGFLRSRDGKVLYQAMAPTSGRLTIPTGTEAIANSAFASEAITELVLPKGLKVIGEMAFYRTQIRSLTLPDSVTWVYSDAFRECTSLESVTLGSNTDLDCVYVGGMSMKSSGQFYGCTALKTLVIPEGVKAISQACFAECSSLASVKLPSTLERIVRAAFGNCRNLAKVTGGQHLVRIEEQAFQNATFSSFPFGGMNDLHFVSGRAFNLCANYPSPAYPAYLTRNTNGDYTRPDDTFYVKGANDYDSAAQGFSS